jgi:ATP-binding cassette subfamily B protein
VTASTLAIEKTWGLLAELPEEIRALVAGSLVRFELEFGGEVQQAGEPVTKFVLLESGRVRLSIHETCGTERSLGMLHAGDGCGHRELASGDNRARVSARASSHVVGYRLDASVFRALLANCPAAARFFQQCDPYDAALQQCSPLEKGFADSAAAHGPRAVGVVTPQLPLPATSAPLREMESDCGAPLVSRPRRFRSRQRRFPLVRQVDEMDCGVASLAMVCKWFGGSANVTRLRQLTRAGSDGVSLGDLCTAGGEIGLAARAVKVSSDRLDQMPLPAVVHWEGNHWVVLYEVRKHFVRIADPACGHRRLSQEEFCQHWSGYAALFDYSADFRERAKGNRERGASLWPFVRPFAGLLGQVLLLAVVASGLEMLLPLFTQVIVDKVVVDRDLVLLRALTVTSLIVVVFLVLALLVQRYLLAFVAVRVDAQALDFLTRHLLALPMSYFQSRRTGDIQRRLDGLRQVREFFVDKGIRSITAITQLSAALLLMFIYSPTLAGIYLAVGPVYALLMQCSAKYLRPIFDHLEESFARYNSNQIDAIRGIMTVKAMGAEDSWRNLMLQHFQSIARRMFRADLAVMAYETVIRAVAFLSVALFLWAGARQVVEGRLTIGGLVAFNALVVLANAPIQTLLSMWDDWQETLVQLCRLNDILRTEPEQGNDRSQLQVLPVLQGHVNVRNLSLRASGHTILDDVSLDLSAGTVVAIVGRSGSGKTTLLKCLAGLIPPTDGNILFDGHDLARLSLRHVRRRIGLVTQDSHLFDDTIAANIALGDNEPDMERVLAAARSAYAHDFIEQLPFGYQTRVGETGLALSGGQRQRIAIARALYHDPPILIFDEATSALDTESERQVQKNLQQLLSGRTCVLVAHRLSTIRRADRIIVMERGRIAESGTHEELQQLKGLYHYFCRQQFGFHDDATTVQSSQ